MRHAAKRTPGVGCRDWFASGMMKLRLVLPGVGQRFSQGFLERLAAKILADDLALPISQQIAQTHTAAATDAGGSVRAATVYWSVVDNSEKGIAVIASIAPRRDRRHRHSAHAADPLECAGSGRLLQRGGVDCAGAGPLPRFLRDSIEDAGGSQRRDRPRSSWAVDEADGSQLDRRPGWIPERLPLSHS
jgi:hypothetical protein